MKHSYFIIEFLQCYKQICIQYWPRRLYGFSELSLYCQPYDLSSINQHITKRSTDFCVKFM